MLEVEMKDLHKAFVQKYVKRLEEEDNENDETTTCNEK